MVKINHTTPPAQNTKRKEEWEMKKKLCLAMACMLLLTSLVGCGSQSSGEESNSSTIKIGYFGPLTGGTAQAGQAALNGVQIAVNELNEAGGVLGKQLEIVSYDDKSSPEEAVKAATKLVQVDKVNAIFGSLHSANVQAAAPVIEEAKTICVAGGTSPTWLEQGYTYLFRSISNSSVSAKQNMRIPKICGKSLFSPATANMERPVPRNSRKPARTTTLSSWPARL